MSQEITTNNLMAETANGISRTGRMIFLLSCSTWMAACGVSDTTQTAIDAATTQASETSTGGDALYVADETGLPTCDATIKNRLVYVKSLSAFQTCNGTAWSTVSIQGPAGTPGTDGAAGATGAVGARGATGAAGAAGATGAAGTAGMTITKKWKFHVDSFVGEPNICSEAYNYSAWIGDVRIYKFSDGSYFVAVSGIAADFGDTYTEKIAFSHSFLVRAGSTADLVETFKFDSNGNARIRYTIGTSGSTPTFRAVVDVDGSFSDNTDSIFIMTEVL